ncbi:MAG: DUF2256 domain-containing protein [Gluconacetobacter diazotrophicus]|nr:DUF2256 domain-containing protein [Gluconacetobacter diazotrophicus]
MPRGVRKQDLPRKDCAACGRPFAWRKKWERDWDRVRYCSDSCREGRRPAVPKAQAGRTSS